MGPPTKHRFKLILTQMLYCSMQWVYCRYTYPLPVSISIDLIIALGNAMITGKENTFMLLNSAPVRLIVKRTFSTVTCTTNTTLDGWAYTVHWLKKRQCLTKMYPATYQKLDSSTVYQAQPCLRPRLGNPWVPRIWKATITVMFSRFLQ